jgi:hypothetical protein
VAILNEQPERITALTDLLAEAGSLLNAIRARDGPAYHRSQDWKTPYMPEEDFDSLVERIREGLGGDILTALWAAQARRNKVADEIADQ